ncbi:MAG: hypothetical protein QM803_18905 [Rhodocyclaceae bacterium]
MLDRIFFLDVLRYLLMVVGVWWFVWVVWSAYTKKPDDEKGLRASDFRRKRSLSRDAPLLPPVSNDPYFTGNRTPTSGAFDLLANAVGGDVRAANRLVQYELSRAPGISRGEAIARAMDRLARDRS